MVEIVEIKHMPGIAKGWNVLVNSVDDLKKIAEAYKVPIILKCGKEHYIRVPELNGMVTYKG